MLPLSHTSLCVCVLVEEGDVSVVEQSRALSCARKDAKAPLRKKAGI